MRERESIFRFPFSAHAISYSFIDLNEDVWSVCTCVWFTPDGSCCLRPHTLSPSTPWSPSRLSGRAADRLSDEMMTLLWEVILKWKVSAKDCAPSLTHHSISPPVLQPAVWIMIDLFQMARRKHPLIFQCFIKKYLFTVVSLGHGRDLSSQFPNGAWLKKGRFSPPHNKINDLQYYFRNESISSVTKWILIGYNETWVWLELFQEACCTRHCQRVAIQLVISQLGQDKPHTVNIPDDESTCSAQLFAWFLMLHTISQPDQWINSVLVCKRFEVPW